MCDPATMALMVGTAASATTGAAATAGIIGTAGVVSSGFMAGVSAVSTVAGLAGQAGAANSMAASNAAQGRNLMLSRAQNANQVNLERVQAGDAAGQKLNANNMALREAQATTVARAGPSGLSVDALLSDMGRKGASYNDSVNANLERTNLAMDNQLTNLNTQTTSGFNQMKTPAAPDYLGTALRIGGDYYKSTKTT